LSVVIGGVVFQNGMGGKSQLFKDARLNANLTIALTGDNAAANMMLISDIADRGQQMVVREGFASSLRNIWILCACMAGSAVVCGAIVGVKVLSEVHVETKMGVEQKRCQEIATEN